MSSADTTVRPAEPRPKFGAQLGGKALVVVLSAAQFGRVRVMGSGPLTIGRARSSELRILDPQVSAEHCRITAVEGEIQPGAAEKTPPGTAASAQSGAAGGRYSIEDRGSTNGTFLNGRRIEGPVSLHYGDRIMIGSTILRFYVEEKPDRAAR